MQSSRVEIGNPLIAGGTTIVPVLKTSLSGWGDRRLMSFSAAKYVVAVVVISPSLKKAFRMTGEEVPLDQLAREIPGIEDVLTRL